MMQRKIVLSVEEPSPSCNKNNLYSFNAERVAELKAAIQQGEYRININKLAQQMMKFEKEFFST